MVKLILILLSAHALGSYSTYIGGGSGGSGGGISSISVGTTGTDISADGSTINIPSASGTNRGALTSANWTTFNNKYGSGSTILAADGTSGAPGFGFATDTNTGWVGGNDGEWDYYANGSRRFKFGGSLRIYSLLGGGENAAIYQQGSQLIADMSSSDGAFKVLTDDSARGAQLSLAPTGREWLIHSLPATNTNSVSGAVNGLAFLNDASASDVPLYLSGKSDVGLGNALANKLSQVTIQPRATANITGTTTVNASTTVTGTSTKFLSELGIGDTIVVSSAATEAKVTAIASDTSLTVDTALGDGTSQTISRQRSILRIDDASDAMKLVVDTDGFVGLQGIHPKVSLDTDGAIATRGTTIDITADDQAVIASGRSLIRFTSDNSTSTNRTIALGDGGADGQRLTLIWYEDTATGAGEIADNSNTRLTATWTPGQFDTLTLVWDSADSNWLELSRADN